MRRLHAELALLGTGWTGKIEHVPPGLIPLAWEVSRGPISTIRLEPVREAVSLKLAPVGCRSEYLAITGGGAQLGQTLRLHSGFHWYRIRLSQVKATAWLAFSPRCAPSPDTGRPERTAQPLAVAIAAIAWTHTL